MRSPVTVEGLAVTGPASVGDVSFPAPTVAWTRRGGEALPALNDRWPLSVEDGAESPLGARAVRLVGGTGAVELRFPVLAPEVSGVAGGVEPAAPRVALVHWPPDAAGWERLRADQPAMIVLANARVLFQEGEPFVRAIRDVREHAGAAPLLWAPRVALPHRMAFLTYVGVDLTDVTEARWRAQHGAYLDETLGELSGPDARRRCACPHCTDADPRPETHLRWVFEREGGLVRAALAERRLRELVEARLSAEPALAELLRYADRVLGPLLEDRTPVVATGVRNYVLRESQRRPEVRRYLQRLEERYRPPPSKEVLVVLPCSKTKPYRHSPSHRRYARALDGLPHPERVHVVSVTSPLGAVPKELEDVYPARHYDIPVTGEWDESERLVVQRALTHLMATGRYRGAVFHLDPEEYGFLRDRLPAGVATVWSSGDDRTSSAPALDSLRRAVQEVLAETGPVPGGPLSVVKEELREVAAFQFGRAAAEELFAEPTRLMGRPWFQRLTDGAHRDLATWREERGLFQLTTAGAARMRSAGAYTVEVAPGLELAGDLFTPGVASVGSEIRAGDAVLLGRDGQLLGVGEAELSARLMRELPRGRAVAVRHRVHPTGSSADTKMTADEVPSMGRSSSG